MYNKKLNEYTKENYKQFCIRLNKNKEKDIIDYLEDPDVPLKPLITSLLREHMAKIKE